MTHGTPSHNHTAIITLMLEKFLGRVVSAVIFVTREAGRYLIGRPHAGFTRTRVPKLEFPSKSRSSCSRGKVTTVN